MKLHNAINMFILIFSILGLTRYSVGDLSGAIDSSHLGYSLTYSEAQSLRQTEVSRKLSAHLSSFDSQLKSPAKESLDLAEFETEVEPTPSLNTIYIEKVELTVVTPLPQPVIKFFSAKIPLSIIRYFERLNLPPPFSSLT